MNDVYHKAKKRVKTKKKFFNELFSFVFISLLLIFINIFTSPGYLWFLWAVVPWGLMLVLRGVRIGIESNFGNWEDKAMRRELEAMGEDPEDYLDEQLELKDLDEAAYQKREKNDNNYRKSDLV